MAAGGTLQRWWQAPAAATLLALVASLVASPADAQQMGDWLVERSRELVVATTRNASDSVFGYACNRQSNECLFFYMPDKLKCNEGGRYALLINGGNESTSRSTTCRSLGWREGQQYANVLDGSDALRKQLLNAGDATIGIARGTGSDGFSISKFSMRGFRGAYEKVNRYREEHGGPPPRDYNTDSRGSGADIELFEHANFQGRHFDARNDVANLADHNFNDVVSSIIVHRGNWQVCTNAYYRGNCLTYGPGRYGYVGDNNDKYSSFRRIN